MLAKNKSFTRCSAAKRNKMPQIQRYHPTNKTSEIFVWHHTGVEFSFQNIFTNIDSSAKVSVPVEA